MGPNTSLLGPIVIYYDVNIIGMEYNWIFNYRTDSSTQVIKG